MRWAARNEAEPLTEPYSRVVHYIGHFLLTGNKLLRAYSVLGLWKSGYILYVSGEEQRSVRVSAPETDPELTQDCAVDRISSKSTL